jgi:formylglycine-generating enzyme required for sulfatase activity
MDMTRRILVTILMVAAATGCVDKQSFPLFKDWEPGPSGDSHSRLADGSGDIGNTDTGVVAPDAPVPQDVTLDASDTAHDLVDLVAPDLVDTISPDIAPELLEVVDALGPDGCIPDCEGRECGEDGCGGSCWTDETAECDDGMPCTADSCELDLETAVCVHDAVEDGPAPACDDGNPCTDDLCQQGECANPLSDGMNLLELGCVCSGDDDCLPLDNDDACDGTLFCQKTNEGDEEGVCAVDDDTVPAACGNGQFCDGQEWCDPDTGNCMAGDVPLLDDGIGCTVDSCNEETNQVDHLPFNAECDDGNPCTEDTCSPGAEGDDGNGCLHTAIDDGPHDGCIAEDVCTTGGACLAGQCVFMPFDCDDENPCTDDSCSDSGGQPLCSNTPNTVACDDGVACTLNDTCLDGSCQGTPSDAACDDSDVCTGTESCDPESGCVGGESLDCDDGLSCSTEFCDPEAGCTYSYHHEACDDGNPCTDELCDADLGCQHAPNALDCDDDDPCTLGDMCSAGECTPGALDTAQCGDYDHDGLMNKEDSCPYAFDPEQLDLDGNGSADACEPLAGNFPHQRLLTLTQSNAPSTWRRTHEPVEIPLTNGIIDDSVVGYWKLDGGQAVDYSGNGHHGTVEGATTTDGAFGDESGALAFDGQSASFVTLPDGTMNGLPEATVLAWAKPSHDHTGAIVYAMADASLDFFPLLVASEGRLRSQLNSAGNNFLSIVSEPNVLVFDEWNLVGVTYDGSIARLFANGRLLEPAQESSDNCEGPLFLNDMMRLGMADDNGEQSFSGDIDEVLLFNRALSPDEIETYYRSTAPYGTSFVPYAQRDFDDVRMTEIPASDDPLQTGEAVKRTRIIGPRPHSDTPCPAGADEGTYAHRDDLCGVVGYWRLDGDTKDVTTAHNGSVAGDPAFIRGRFGDPAGALSAAANSSAMVVADSPDLQTATGTWEFWVRPTACPHEVLMRKNTPNACANDLTIYLTGDCTITVSRDVAGCTYPLSPSTEVLPMGVWSHVAVTWDGNSVDTYVNGLHSATLPDVFPVEAAGSPIYVGGDLDKAAKVALDEVLIHNVAKSPDYIYHRARPGLPKVRFLANSTVTNGGTDEAPAYGWRDYVLYWGDAAATARMPFVSPILATQEPGTPACYGLLNGCHGYAGWWRFNEGSGAVAVDSATWKNNGEIVGGPLFSVGLAGTGLFLDGDDDFILVPDSPALGLQAFTLEGAANPTQFEPIWSDRIVSKGSTEAQDNQNYYLGYDGGGYLNAGFEYGADLDVHVLAESKSSTNGWLVHTARYDGTALSIWDSGHPVAETLATVIPGKNSSDVTLGADHKGTPDTFWHFFHGSLDEVRLSNRALQPDEFLHYPLAGWVVEAGGPELVDSDGDGILDDGDFSGDVGDHPCTGGQVVGCDDNAVDSPNADQDDGDGDGIGQVVDNCLETVNPQQSDVDNDGIGDACDPDADYDHDGLMGAQDTCPYAFDPEQLDLDGNGSADACEPLAGNFPYQRTVTFTQAGQPSSWRRTHEPVELPLANGVLDSSVVGYWPLSGGDATDKGLYGHNGDVGTGVSPSQGVFGEADGAMVFDGSPNSRIVLPSFDEVDNRASMTMGAWLNPSSVYGPGNVNNGFLSRIHADGEAHSSMVLEEGHLATAINFDGDFVKLSSDVVPVGTWTHVVQVYDGKTLTHFINGRLVASTSKTYNGVTLSGQKTLSDGNFYSIGCMTTLDNGQTCVADRDFKGAIQDVLIANRALTPDEIATWYASGARYGTTIVPSAQGDFDDVRVTETPGMGDPLATGETVKRSRIIGVHPHSDTPCPMDVDDGSWADREDLCGVTAYWRLDGDATDVTGKHPGTNAGASPTPGRFGLFNSAYLFFEDDIITASSIADETDLAGPALTLETWFQWSGALASGQDEAFLLGKGQTSDKSAYSLYVSNQGTLTCKVGTGAGDQYISTPDFASGRWTHVACTYDGSTVRLFVDGLEQASVAHSGSLQTSGFPFTIGRFHTGTDGFVGRLDEVIIHHVAKSPDYLYHRARPGVPKVRFLANTEVLNVGPPEAPAYPWRGYALHWGDADATAIMPFVSSLAEAPDVVPDTCYGLLNGCLGYAGWWRFDEGRGDVAVDSSGWKNNGKVWGTSVVKWLAGLAGPAVSFEVSNALILVPDSDSLYLGTELTLEFGMQNLADLPQRLLSKQADGNSPGIKVGYDSQKLNLLLTRPNVAWANPGFEVPAAVGFKSIAAVYSGSRSFSHGYLDQVKSGDAEWLEGIGSVDNDAHLSFGRWEYSPSGAFLGALDEIRLSTRALEPDELLHYPLAGWSVGEGSYAHACGGMVCPQLDGYTPACNARDFCEYARTNPTQDWHQWDVWIYVPPGSFMMGSEGEGGNDDEMPVHFVTIGAGFLVGKYEVVVSQYDACMVDAPDQCTGPSVADYDEGGWGLNTTDKGRADHPQNGLTWYQSKAVCAWLTPGGRLPSEAEWEYAAGGPAGPLYPWGDTPAPSCDNNTVVMNELGGVENNGCGSGGTLPVGQMTAGMGHFGTLDMAGNLSEWTLDMYHTSYNGAPADGSPWLVPTDTHYVLRSLDFRTPLKGARCSERTNSTPGLRRVMYGARCVKPVSP